jgi:PKD domain
VLACQDGVSLQEPNQPPGLNPEGGYTAGLADVIINDLSIEQQDVVVDPFLTGWYQTATKAEQGDMCKYAFGPPPTSPPPANEFTHAAGISDETLNGQAYYLAWAFDSSDLTSGKGFNCWQGVTLEPYFTAPNPVNSGDIVGFNATESYITLNANTTGLPANEPYAATVYTWNFGDGTTVSGPNDASEFHSYQYGGTYTVTLTVVDSGGNTNSTIRQITVVGPPPPPPGSSSSGQTTQAGGSSPSTGSSPGVVPAPVAAASIVPQSLRTALRKGLVVSYSVNEQVAGHFEVLLSRARAHQLGISGAPAVGLAPGSPAEIVIAKALLVTTKGGHSAIHMQFSKQTASRLAHVHKLSLMLRLIVRNAASSNPATTTVISSVTLNG